jgi:hypothetical protein
MRDQLGSSMMSYARSFAAKYPTNSIKSSIITAYSKIKATEKWIEYSLDITEMTKLLSSTNREERQLLVAAIAIAERKRDYMYKHPNFRLEEATREFKQAKRLLKL